MDIDWNDQLVDQLDWHWHNQLRPRLAGITDDEYFWEPVPGCWSVRRRGEGSAPVQVGAGEWLIDWGYPEPTPAPVTTIAWRLAHLGVSVFGMRNAAHFGAGPVDYDSREYDGTAAAALRRLDAEYATWAEGVRKPGAD